MYPAADPEGGFRGFKPPPLQRLFFFFFACQYNIPTDLDPKPPLRRILAQNPPPPPLKEFLDPPLVPQSVVHSMVLPQGMQGQ